MDSPLQIFRDLLPFGPSSAALKSSAAVRGMLDTVAGLSPQETIAKLAASVLPTANRQPNLHMRFKLLEDIRHEAEQALPPLEKEVTQAVLPLPYDVTGTALQADNLLKGLAIAYAGIARGMLKNQMESGLSHLFHRNVHRAMAMIARRQLLAYRAYAAPSATSWLSLHDLYQFVRGPLNTPLNGETAPIEHEYLGALLFAYLEPSKLPRSELDTIHACSRQLAAYATIGDAPADPASVRHPEACFLVRPDDAAPGYPLSRLPANVSTFGGLLVDCSQVLAALDRNLTRRPGKAVEPDLSAAPALLQSLRIAIGGKSARRFSRTHFRPRGDLVVGLPAVISFVGRQIKTTSGSNGDQRLPPVPLVAGRDDNRLLGRRLDAQHVPPAIGRHVGERRALLDPGIPDHDVGKPLTLHGQAEMTGLQQLRPLDPTIDAIHLGLDCDMRAAIADDDIAPGGVAIIVAVKPFQRHILDLDDAQIGVQCTGESERGRTGIGDTQFEVDAVGLDHHRQLEAEGMRPQGAGRLIIGQFEGEQRIVVATTPGTDLPFAGPHETVPGQIAQPGKLRPADRNAAPDGDAAIEYGLVGQIQALAAIRRDPGKHLRAQLADDGAGALRAIQAQGRNTVEFDVFNGGGHGYSVQRKGGGGRGA